jgi:hypothetical protein
MPPFWDDEIRKLEQDIARQQALVRRMIVQGVPNQAAEDRLHQLQHQLSQARERSRQQHRT